MSVRERAIDLDKKNLKKPIDKIKNLWYNNYRKKEKSITKKFLKKVLTKPKKYAIIVIQGKGKTSRPKEKNLKKVKKKS